MMSPKDEGAVVVGLYLESTLCGGGSENDARKASLASISEVSCSDDGSLPCFDDEVVELEDCDGRVVNYEPSSSENKKDVLWKKLGMLFRPRQEIAVVVDTDFKAEVTQDKQSVSYAPLMTEEIEDVASKRRGMMWRKFGINLLRPRPEQQQSQNADDDDCTITSSTTCSTVETPALPEVETSTNEQTNSDISEEMKVQKGGGILVGHIGRDAAVNAAVLVTSILSGDTSAIIGAYIAGGAVTSKRLVDGIISRDEKEVTKSLAVLCYWSIDRRSGVDLCTFARSGRCKFTCGGCGGIWCWMLQWRSGRSFERMDCG